MKPSVKLSFQNANLKIHLKFPFCDRNVLAWLILFSISKGNLTKVLKTRNVYSTWKLLMAICQILKVRHSPKVCVLYCTEKFILHITYVSMGRSTDFNTAPCHIWLYLTNFFFITSEVIWYHIWTNVIRSTTHMLVIEKEMKTAALWTHIIL